MNLVLRDSNLPWMASVVGLLWYFGLCADRLPSRYECTATRLRASAAGATLILWQLTGPGKGAAL